MNLVSLLNDQKEIREHSKRMVIDPSARILPFGEYEVCFPNEVRLEGMSANNIVYDELAYVDVDRYASYDRIAPAIEITRNTDYFTSELISRIEEIVRELLKEEGLL